ncbi:MAG: hypothetical protein JWP08_510 [Bryobacterales bacterium]|nr:hypothetical protein [Bryobacterales bacterium]
MKPRSLLVAAIILAALSSAVWWAKKHPQSGTTGTPATPAAPKLADVPQAKVKQVEIAKKGGPRITLDSKNGRWSITTPDQYPADQEAVTTLLSSVSPLNADTVVDENPKDVEQFGLKDPPLIVTLHQTDGKTDQFFIGGDVPANSLVYLRLGSKPAVYAVASTFKTSVDKSVNDLRDKRLLTFDTNKLTSVEVGSSKGDVVLGKNNQGDWQIVKPHPDRADSFQVEELLRKLGDAKMDLSASADDQKKTAVAFASGQPVGAAKVTDASGMQSIEVRKDKADYYARSSIVKGIYKVSADVGQVVGKAPDDFRNKKVFDFGFNDPTKIEVQQGAASQQLARSGTDWKMNGKILDGGSVQAFIDKARDLAATKFLPSGFTSPAAVVSITSNDGKRFEKVEFAKVADGYIARRENEPTLYHLDAKPVDDMLEASKGIKPASSKK